MAVKLLFFCMGLIVHVHNVISHLQGWWVSPDSGTVISRGQELKSLGNPGLFGAFNKMFMNLIFSTHRSALSCMSMHLHHYSVATGGSTVETTAELHSSFLQKSHQSFSFFFLKNKNKHTYAKMIIPCNRRSKTAITVQIICNLIFFSKRCSSSSEVNVRMILILPLQSTTL